MNYLLMVDDAPGALDAAWQQYECCSEGGIVHGQQIALTNVATCETALGRYESAIERLEGLLNQKQRLGLTLDRLALTLAFRNGPGDVERALAYGSEAWPLLRRQSRATGLLEVMGVAHARRGAPDLAARLMGHARAARAQDGEVSGLPFGALSWLFWESFGRGTDSHRLMAGVPPGLGSTTTRPPYSRLSWRRLINGHRSHDASLAACARLDAFENFREAETLR